MFFSKKNRRARRKARHQTAGREKKQRLTVFQKDIRFLTWATVVAMILAIIYLFWRLSRAAY
jgi:hypothetical protein